MRNIRGMSKREAEYYRTNPLQHCQVCGRPFIRRKDVVCSKTCLMKLEQQQRASKKPANAPS
jgi:predicted nucleic acid-binding Zn ribbon protein